MVVSVLPYFYYTSEGISNASKKRLKTLESITPPWNLTILSIELGCGAENREIIKKNLKFCLFSPKKLQSPKIGPFPGRENFFLSHEICLPGSNPTQSYCEHVEFKGSWYTFGAGGFWRKQLFIRKTTIFFVKVKENLHFF